MFTYLVVAALLFSLTTGLTLARRLSVFALIPTGLVIFWVTSAYRFSRGVDLKLSLLTGVLALAALQAGYLIGLAALRARRASNDSPSPALDSAAYSDVRRIYSSKKL